MRFEARVNISLELIAKTKYLPMCKISRRNIVLRQNKTDNIFRAYLSYISFIYIYLSQCGILFCAEKVHVVLLLKKTFLCYEIFGTRSTSEFVAANHCYKHEKSPVERFH